MESDKTDSFGGIDINRKTGDSHECRISLLNYFFEINFEFQPCISSHCHSLIQKSFSFDDVAIATVKGNNEKKKKNENVRHKVAKHY